jgi:hypothetical protein
MKRLLHAAAKILTIHHPPLCASNHFDKESFPD